MAGCGLSSVRRNKGSGGCNVPTTLWGVRPPYFILHFIILYIISYDAQCVYHTVGVRPPQNTFYITFDDLQCKVLMKRYSVRQYILYYIT